MEPIRHGFSPPFVSPYFRLQRKSEARMSLVHLGLCPKYLFFKFYSVCVLDLAFYPNSTLASPFLRCPLWVSGTFLSELKSVSQKSLPEKLTHARDVLP